MRTGSLFRHGLVVAALAVAVLALPAAPALAVGGSPGGANPQGVDAQGRPLTGGGRLPNAAVADSVGPAVTRNEILARARTWADAPVPYSQTAYRDGYRTDCSGYISMAWRTNRNYWTGDLHTIGVPIAFTALKPGDMLLYHNASNPVNGSHVVLFERWVGAAGGDFFIYEQTPPHTMHRKWSQTSGRNLSNYKPYRYVNVIDSTVTGSLGDLDNAGRADMLAMVSNGDLYVYPNVGASGTTTWGARYLVCSGCGEVDSINVADLSNDGKPDLVARFRDGNIWVYPNTGQSGTTTWGARYLVCGLCGGFDAVNTGDLSNDGKPDLVVREASTGNVYVYPNTGSPGGTTWGARYLVCGICGGFDAVNIGDLSNDGQPDLVVREASTGNIYVYPNTGSTGTTTWGARYLVCGICGSFTAVNLGDLNTDGTVDLMVREPNGNLYVYPNTGSTGTTTWGPRYLVCTGCDTFRDIN